MRSAVCVCMQDCMILLRSRLGESPLFIEIFFDIPKIFLGQTLQSIVKIVQICLLLLLKADCKVILLYFMIYTAYMMFTLLNIF